MKTKRFSSCLILLICFSLVFSTTVSAANYYSPGPYEYELERSRLVEQEKASLNGNNLVFEAGGSMSFDIQVPFDSDKLVLTYEDSSLFERNISLLVDGKSFTAKLGRLSNTVEMDIQATYGSKVIKLISDRAATISGVKFIKIKEYTWPNVNDVIELDEYDEALLTAVVIGIDSPVIKSRGAIRRIDVFNPTVTPKTVSGSIYLPLNIIAQELKLYSEDYSDKSYVLLRDDRLELALIGGNGFLTDEYGNKKAIEMNVLYENGTTWLPVRQLAELFGFYVNWSDGVAVIDDRIQTTKIIENANVFTKLKAELAEYIPTAGLGKTYYVAQTASASDANSGTAQYPFATISKAADIAKAGDTVIIHEGIYRETVTPKNNGTKSAPIVFKAAEGESVTISALEPVNEFVKYDESIYCAALPKDLGVGRNQLFYKGEALTEGRHPNVQTNMNVSDYPEDVPDKLYATKGNISIKTQGATVATSDTDLDYPEDHWKGGVFVALKGEGWNLVSGDITGSKPGEISLDDHEGAMSYTLGIKQGSWFNILYNDTTTIMNKVVHPEHDWGYITNHINTIDIPGEWYIGDGKIFVYPPEGANLTSDFEVKQRQLTVDLRNRKYITIEGINTLGGGMTMYGDTEGNVINGGSHKYICHFTKCIDNQMGYINPGDSRFGPGAPHAGEFGLFIGGSNNAIMNTDIEWSAGAGIYGTGRYHLISNNIVANTSYMGSYPGGITIMNDMWDIENEHGGHTIVNNESYNAGRGVFLYCFSPQPGQTDSASVPSLPSEIAYNKFYNGSLMTRDTGVTYEYSTIHGNDRIRTTMHHNYVYDMAYFDEPTSGMIFLLYQDGYVNGRETYNNVTFYSDDIVPMDGVFENAPYTKVRMWNNSDLGYVDGGVDGLTDGDYPGGRPFYAGTKKQGNERYMVNYNNISQNSSVINYPSSVDTSGDTPVYKFDNVYFKGDSYTRLTMNYKRSKEAEQLFNALITIEGNGKKINLNAPVYCEDDEWYVDALSEGYAFVEPLPEGNYSITIKFSDNMSELCNLTTSKSTEEFAGVTAPEIIYCGTYDNWIPGPNPPGGTFGIAASGRLDDMKTGSWLFMHNTWCHTVEFKDRQFDKAFNAVELRYGTSTGHGGQTLRIYADSLDSEPIVETVLTGNSWEKKNETVNLLRTLEPGTHTLYMTFEGGGQTPEGGCSNFYYMKFLENAIQEVAE